MTERFGMIQSGQKNQENQEMKISYLCNTAEKSKPFKVIFRCTVNRGAYYFYWIEYRFGPGADMIERALLLGIFVFSNRELSSGILKNSLECSAEVL
jgi:hypothetical protein